MESCKYFAIMPWVRRTRTQNRIYRMAAGIGSVLFGILAGYALWGQTASMVTNVEQELSRSEAQVKRLEKRIQALEAKLLADENSSDTISSVRTH